MKIKGLLLGMFACAALAACTDNDIVENAPDSNNKGEKAEAYLTFSVAASGNSSRAGTTTGDKHGDEDDSEHYNTGTAKENKVSSIMIVFYNADQTDGDGMAVKYDIEEGSTSMDIKENSDGTYSPVTPYQLSTTGKYMTLVIINPNETIAAKATGKGVASSVKTIYDDILKGTNSNIDNIIGAEKDAFMMVNKTEVDINVTKANNSPASAAGLDEVIEVERVASKITFRPTTLADFTAAGVLKDGANVYKVNASHTTYTVDTSDGWVADGNSYIYYTVFNEATTNDNSRQEIYVLIRNGEQPAFYTKGSNHTGYVGGVEKTAPVMTPYDMGEKKPVYQGTAGQPVDVPYYVRLERYALVNLNNQVYNVRHTNANPTSADDAKPFGTVSSSNYLFEPNTAAKSNVNLNNWNTADKTGEAWFGNTAIDNVEEAIKGNVSTTLDTYFKALPTTNNDNGEYDESKNEGTVTGNTPEASAVGSVLAYCMENAVLNTNQSPRLTTGIVFEAQIYDTNGVAVSCMYKYSGSFYKDLKSLNDATNNQFEGYLDENNTDGELDETLSTLGIEVFRNGKCYYFSSEIKHFDDNKEDKGVMEYAIMRNNIYSLEVGNVDGFGFASTEIVPGETGGGSGDESVYLTLNARILPWIVRFNNIEF